MKAILSLFILLVATNSLFAKEEDVLRIQKKLTQLGYYHDSLDGILGSCTSAALRRFQIANHLHPTGRLDKETLALLENKHQKN